MTTARNQKAKEKDMPNMELGEAAKADQKVQFVDVPVEVLGKYKGKNYVDLKGLAFNGELGHLSMHLGDKHTMIFKSNFQRDYLKVVMKQVDKVEQSVKRAPEFDRSKSEQSTARMKFLGERNGRTFVGPSGSVKFDGSLRGFVVNLDDKHTMILDGQTLSKELGLKAAPIALEKNLGIER